MQRLLALLHFEFGRQNTTWPINSGKFSLPYLHLLPEMPRWAQWQQSRVNVLQHLNEQAVSWFPDLFLLQGCSLSFSVLCGQPFTYQNEQCHCPPCESLCITAMLYNPALELFLCWASNKVYLFLKCGG